uniref:Fibronectin type-III domain-containing protein n=2 Tax=Micrurus TaxID=8634 RepID=A0A2D4J3T2_MICLE
MISRLVFLLFCGHFAQILGNAGKLPRVKKQSLKVQINVTSDAVCMRYIRPTPSTKLEGFVLGYGSSFFSNQYIPLPSNGKMYMTEIDAEPRYMIVVRPVSNKKSCSGKTKTPKPLQLVIGTLTPTSVFLSWGILVNPKHDWTTMNNCPNDRFYTVRYREKDKNKKWILQLCPTTETVVDNLKPNTIYEFGVKDNTDDGIWSKNFIHKVIISGKNKENEELQNNYKLLNIQTQFIPGSKTFVPVKVIKQVLQNITHRSQPEILKNSPLSGPILVHLIVPDFNATKQKSPSSSRLDIFEKPKQSVAMAEQDLERNKPTAPGVPKDSAVSQAHSESELESLKPSKAPMTEMPPVTLDLHKFLGLPKTRPSPRPQMPTQLSVSKKMQPVPLEPKTPVPKTIQIKAASKEINPSKSKEFDYTKPEEPDRKFDAKTKHHVPITKTTINPLLPKSAPKEAHEVPTRPITPSSPDITPNKSSLNIKYHDPSKPKSRPGQKTQQSKPETIPFSQDLITTMVPVAPEKTKEILDPKETQLLPSKPKPSDKQGRNKTKPASSKLNNKVTVTKTPRLRKVVHRTTPAPPRTRPPGGSSWSKKPRGEKLPNEDVPKLLHPSSSTNSSVSMDSTVVRKKPDPGTLPASSRPPLAPARPTPIRRRPLPPNNVTGKPGRSGNVLMPRASSFITTSIAKPTWPSSLVKTNSPKKLPTAAASPDYSNPMFSSIPTSETDIAGTPRYTGDHVKYLKKKDDVPCSITDTMQLFPTDMGDNRDMATSAPQKPPTNLTVVTVEGCPSFVVLDWKPPENESVTEYKVVSTENGGTAGKDKSIITTNQTHSTVENLKPNTSYEFVVIASNPLGEGPSSESKPFRTESADPRITESISMGKDAIWTEVRFNSDDYSECKGKQYVKRTWYKKFVGVQLCNSLRYKIYLSDSLKGTFYNIGDQRGHGEDHCQFVDSYLDGKTGQMLPSDQLPSKDGYFRAVRQEPVHFGKIGVGTHSTYVHWYECGTTIPGKW